MEVDGENDLLDDTAGSPTDEQDVIDLISLGSDSEPEEESANAKA